MRAEFRIREVRDLDLPIFFEHQRDPEGVRMAIFEPRERPAFDAHWEKIRKDPDTVLRTIVAGDAVAGYVGSWVAGSERLVAYWIGREWWGKGAATSALAQLLPTLPAGPVFARVATSNAGSRRVLEKCGFTPRGKETGHDGVEEILMRLDR
jgi:RimJ/RimL family protein N-acetyltransferase